MTSAIQLLKDLEEARFQQILGASPKKFREELFRSAKIRAKGNSFTLKSRSKNADRARRFHQALKGGTPCPSEVCEEIIRNYLYTRRALLAQALDFFGVEHDDGLTDEELDFFSELSEEKLTSLKEQLSQEHDQEDVDLYLKFMAIGQSSED